MLQPFSLSLLYGQCIQALQTGQAQITSENPL